MRTRLIPLTLAAAVALALTGRVASAAPKATPVAGPTTDPAVAAHANDLFRAGREAAASGDDKTACDRFTESEKLQPAPGTQLNLGACEEKQGHLLVARDHYQQAGHGFKPDDVRRAVALNTADGIGARLATLTVHIAPGAPGDLQVIVEGAALDAKILEHGIDLDPGKTTLVVNANGRQPRTVDVDLKEAEKREITVDAGDPLAPSAADATPPPPSADDVQKSNERRSKRSLERTLGFVGAGVGVAGLVVGGVFGGLAFHEASVVKSNCNASFACKPAGVSAASSGETDGVVSTVAFIAGAAFTAVGAYFVITTWGDDPGSSGHHAGQGIVLTPFALRSGGGAAGTWTF